MTIPDIDDTTIRAIAANCAGQCNPPDPLTLISWADIIYDWIDPAGDRGEEITFTLDKQP